MASYHMSAKVIGRSDGRSAVAASAYRGGCLLVRRETGEVQDYTRKTGVVWSEILAPEGAPEWARDRGELWNRVEEKESRKNSQLAREFELALPHELTPEEQKVLVLGWVQSELIARGMFADISAHSPTPGPGQNENEHVHIMCGMREFDLLMPDGWSKNKNRDWNRPELLEELRASWAEHQNRALERAGHTVRVDHRSLEAQRADALERGDKLAAVALNRPPEPRLGVAATSMERKAARAGATEPVTELGRELAAVRSARAALFDALERLRDAARERVEAAKAAAEAARVSMSEAMEKARARYSARAEEPRKERDRGSDFEPGF